MKIFKILSVLLLLCPLTGLGQATTGYHRVSQVIARAPQSVTAQVVPNAKITVTSTATGTAATIYSDPLLTAPISPPVVTSDGSGNYNYYIASGYFVTETITAPGQGVAPIVNIGVSGGGGGSGNCAPTVPNYLLLSTVGGCANSLADYGVTSALTFTFPASGAFGGPTNVPNLVLSPATPATPGALGLGNIWYDSVSSRVEFNSNNTSSLVIPGTPVTPVTAGHLKVYAANGWDDADGGVPATVNSGTACNIAYYLTTGTAVSGDTSLCDSSNTLSYTGSTGISAFALTLNGTASGSVNQTASTNGNWIVISTNAQHFRPGQQNFDTACIGCQIGGTIFNMDFENAGNFKLSNLFNPKTAGFLYPVIAGLEWMENYTYSNGTATSVTCSGSVATMSFSGVSLSSNQPFVIDASFSPVGFENQVITLATVSGSSVSFTPTGGCSSGSGGAIHVPASSLTSNYLSADLNGVMHFGTGPMTNGPSSDFLRLSATQVFFPQIAPGGTQCLQISSLGLVTPTGSGCSGGSSTTFQVNGTPLSSSTTVNFVSGTNVTITNPSAGNINIAASGGGGSPGGSTTQMQYNNAGSFGGTAGITFAGTAGNLAFAGTDTAAAGYRQAIVSNTNSVNIATEQALTQNTTGVLGGIVSAVSNTQFFTPNPPEINAINGILVMGASTLTGLVPGVAVRGSVIITNSGSAGWGGLFSCNDVSGQTNTECWGAELDLNVQNASTQVEGVLVDGSWNATPVSSVAFKVQKPVGSSGAAWQQGFASYPGASIIAFEAGPTANTGASLSSQSLTFDSVDSSSIPHQGNIKANALGDLVLAPFSALTDITGDLNVSTLSGTGTQCAQLTAAGTLSRATIPCGGAGGVVLLVPTGTQTINPGTSNFPLNITTSSTGTVDIFQATGRGATAGNLIEVSGNGGGTGNVTINGLTFQDNQQYLLSVQGGILNFAGNGDTAIYSQSFSSGFLAKHNGLVEMIPGGSTTPSLIGYTDFTTTLNAFTVSTLPTCNSGETNHIAYVTDAVVPVYNAAVTTGSSTGHIIVICDGTTWNAH